jgi:RNA polymerase sigma-70 factor (ECF subfamily)
MNDAQRAYDRIVRPIEDRMIRSIWRIVRDPQDAEDAMQDALLTIWKRWDRVTQHPHPEALVLKISIDAAYDVTRRRLRQRRAVELTAACREPAHSPSSPPDEAIGTEQHAEILRAIHRLSRRQAAATLMRIVEGHSYDEIADALGCTEATARKHVARARGRLQAALAHLAPNNAERG